jgi:hypothetical protein
LVGRSWGSHTKVTLPLKFRQPSPPFPTLLRPAGHPQNGLKFWLVGQLVGQSVSWSVSHGEVTQTSRCLLGFVTRARPSRPFYALWAIHKTALNFGWSVGLLVGRSVCRSWGSHMNVTLPLQFCHPGPFYTLRATPKTAINFGWSVGRSVSRSVGRSVSRSVGRLVTGSHSNITLPLQFGHQGPPFPILLCPAGHPQNGLKFWSVGQLVGWSVGRSFGWSVMGKSHEHHAASSVLSPGPALPDPSLPCGLPPKWP